MPTAKAPHKTALNICLTESVVFLRSVDFTGRRQDIPDAPNCMLRGLLTLDLSKPTRISSIEVELLGKTRVSWPEGVGARRTEVLEEHKVFSATQTFFKASTTPSPAARRTLSVGPGLMYYRDERDHDHPLPAHTPPRNAVAGPSELDGAIRRGRDRTRRRLSADHSIFQRDPVEHHLNSRSPTPVHSPGFSPEHTPPYTPIAVEAPVSFHSHTPTSARSSVSYIPALAAPHPHEVEVVPRDNRSVSRALPHCPPSLSRPYPTSSHSSFRSPAETSLSRQVSSVDERDHPYSAFSEPLSHPTAPLGLDVDAPRREPSLDDYRGRKNWRTSLASVSNVILDAMKERVRSSSPKTARAEREVARGRSTDAYARDVSHSRGRTPEPKGKEREHPPGSAYPHVRERTALERVGEVLGLEEEHKEFGDGWREFKKGTYTFPISFAIPSNVPPTLTCDYGSVTWRLKAYVHRPGTFTTKLTALRDVILVASPSEDDTEDTENIVVERLWDDQLQYRLAVSGRMFHIGGEMPVYMSFLPMAKMKIHRISVILEERVDYWIHQRKFSRSDFTSRFPLLVLKNPSENDKTAPPILPLDSNDATAWTNSPLSTLVTSEDDPSEMAASFMGPGPWTLHATLKLPEACGLLHFTNRNKKSNIQIQHTLKIVLRVERGDDLHVDAKTGKRKLFDIVVQTPVHILSCLCSNQYMYLPRYSETLSDESLPSISPCACPVKRNGHSSTAPRIREPTPLMPAASTLTHSSSLFSHHSHAPQLHINPLERTPTNGSTSSTESVSGAEPLRRAATYTQGHSLYDQNLTYERLITGQESEAGEAPPSYETVVHSPSPASVSAAVVR
ncbi:hypothetical protein DENSPDRAFT_923149 [Dentipellis sp. KUC8613]|nr:hypothetical protein DENSPDRAFT_923149 [Dentipellis sp. KUC8613]